MPNSVPATLKRRLADRRAACLATAATAKALFEPAFRKASRRLNHYAPCADPVLKQAATILEAFEQPGVLVALTAHYEAARGLEEVCIDLAALDAH